MSYRFLSLSTLCFAATSVLAQQGFTQSTERVSVDSQQNQASNKSAGASFSANGRFVAFWSNAHDLVPGDTNGASDVFVHDRLTGATERISVNSFGVQGNDESTVPSISADGRFVSFSSKASNLVPGDTNGERDVFLHDRHIGRTILVSKSSTGEQGNYESFYSAISASGQSIIFGSWSDNLVAGDTNGWSDAFVHDRLTGITERVSIDSQGGQADGVTWGGVVSADGNRVAFASLAGNLVPGDSNQEFDIFVHDRQSGVTKIVSVDSSGIPGNDTSLWPSLSGDGRFVTFTSYSSGLVPLDNYPQQDVFLHDLQTGLTELVGVNSLREQGDQGSWYSAISYDGRYIVFNSDSENLGSSDQNGMTDIFVYDRESGITERISRSSKGAEPARECYYPSISAGGRYVAFESISYNLVPGDTNHREDIFVHDRWSGEGINSIWLEGPTTSPVLSPIDLSWQSTRGSSRYWVLGSPTVSGFVFDGHSFDLGLPVTLLEVGINAVNGIGRYSSPPIPAQAAGLSIYFEIVAEDGAGVLYDSNVIQVQFY